MFCFNSKFLITIIIKKIKINHKPHILTLRISLWWFFKTSSRCVSSGALLLLASSPFICHCLPYVILDLSRNNFTSQLPNQCFNLTKNLTYRHGIHTLRPPHQISSECNEKDQCNVVFILNFSSSSRIPTPSSSTHLLLSLAALRRYRCPHSDY
jgi:hypothetical protein